MAQGGWVWWDTANRALPGAMWASHGPVTEGRAHPKDWKGAEMTDRRTCLKLTEKHRGMPLWLEGLVATANTWHGITDDHAGGSNIQSCVASKVAPPHIRTKPLPRAQLWDQLEQASLTYQVSADKGMQLYESFFWQRQSSFWPAKLTWALQHHFAWCSSSSPCY